MDTSLRGKVAIVCAASKGLGRAAALALAQNGAGVAMCARHEAELSAAAEDIRAATGAQMLPFVADVTRADDLTRLVSATLDRFGGVDILVNNCGGPKSGPFTSLSDQDWDDAIASMLLSVVRLSRLVIPTMRLRGRGRIITITSITTRQPVDGLILSNTLRTALVGFSKSLANELAADGILVNCVAPGYTRTDRVKDLNRAAARREGVDEKTIEKRTVQHIPLGRLAEPHELGDLIAFLASDRGAYITGTTIAVDGGFIKGVF